MSFEPIDLPPPNDVSESDKKEFLKWVRNDFQPPNEYNESLMKTKNVSNDKAKQVFRKFFKIPIKREKRDQVRDQVFDQLGEQILDETTCGEGVNFCKAFAKDEVDDETCRRHIKKKCFGVEEGFGLEEEPLIKIVARRMCHMFPEESVTDVFDPETNTDDVRRFPILNVYDDTGEDDEDFSDANGIQNTNLEELSENIVSYNVRVDDYFTFENKEEHENYVLDIDSVPAQALDAVKDMNIPLKDKVFRYGFEMYFLKVSENDVNRRETLTLKMDFYYIGNTVIIKKSPLYEYLEIEHLKDFFKVIKNNKDRPLSDFSDFYEIEFSYHEEDISRAFLRDLLYTCMHYVREEHLESKDKLDGLEWKPFSSEYFKDSWANTLDHRHYDFSDSRVVQEGGTHFFKEDNRNIISPEVDDTIKTILDEFDFSLTSLIIPHHFTVTCEVKEISGFRVNAEGLRPGIEDYLLEERAAFLRRFPDEEEDEEEDDEDLKIVLV